MSSTDRTGREAYPLLAEELEWIASELRPARARADRAALSWQWRFRAAECVLIAGSVLAVVLGVIAVGGSAGVEPPGTPAGWSRAESVLTGALSALAFAVTRLRLHGRWMQQRTVAETLRAEEFLVLARIGPYADGDHRARLRQRIAQIEANEELPGG